MRRFLTPEVRSWIYRVLLAALPIIVALGIVTDEMSILIGGLVAAILGIGMADGNVPNAPDYQAYGDYKPRHKKD